jgi:drug/metabolite transporter (DMT)-like permease
LRVEPTRIINSQIGESPFRRDEGLNQTDTAGPEPFGDWLASALGLVSRNETKREMVRGLRETHPFEREMDVLTQVPDGRIAPQAATQRSRLPTTVAGTRSEAFGATEWGLLAAIASIWGSSFLFTAVGLETFRPGIITLARVGLGLATLSLFPKARAPVDRADLGRIALLGVLWMGLPLLLFPIAQQWIDSSLAGMLNGAVPLVTAAVATILLRRLPGSRQLAGLVVGFVGVMAISWPSIQGARATAVGTILVLVAVSLYGIAANLAVPLQQRYGALPVLLRAQVVALIVVTPFGLLHLPGSSWAWPSVLAMLPLGLLGTGLAFVAMTVLVGRAGAARGSVSIYFVPVVAILLGVLFRDERVAPIALVGTSLVLMGAWLTSRRQG